MKEAAENKDEKDDIKDTVKLTVVINKPLHSLLKEDAKREKMTLSKFVEHCLYRYKQWNITDAKK